MNESKYSNSEAKEIDNIVEIICSQELDRGFINDLLKHIKKNEYFQIQFEKFICLYKIYLKSAGEAQSPDYRVLNIYFKYKYSNDHKPLNTEYILIKAISKNTTYKDALEIIEKEISNKCEMLSRKKIFKVEDQIVQKIYFQDDNLFFPIFCPNLSYHDSNKICFKAFIKKNGTIYLRLINEWIKSTSKCTECKRKMKNHNFCSSKIKKYIKDDPLYQYHLTLIEKYKKSYLEQNEIQSNIKCSQLKTNESEFHKTNDIIQIMENKIKDIENNLIKVFFIGEKGSGKLSAILFMLNYLMKKDINHQLTREKLEIYFESESHFFYFKTKESNTHYYYVKENDCIELIKIQGLDIYLNYIEIDEAGINNVKDSLNYIENNKINIVFVQKSDSTKPCSSIINIQNYLIEKKNTFSNQLKIINLYSYYVGSLQIDKDLLIYSPLLSKKVNMINITINKKSRKRNFEEHWMNCIKAMEDIVNCIKSNLSEIEFNNQFKSYIETNLIKITKKAKDKIQCNENDEPLSSFHFYRAKDNQFEYFFKIIIDIENKEESFRTVIKYYNDFKKSQNDVYCSDQEATNNFQKAKQFKVEVIFINNDKYCIKEYFSKVDIIDSPNKHYFINSKNEICATIESSSKNINDIIPYCKIYPYKNEQWLYCCVCEDYLHNHYLENKIFKDKKNNLILKSKENDICKIKPSSIQLNDKIKNIYCNNIENLIQNVENITLVNIENDDKTFLYVFDKDFNGVTKVKYIEPTTYSSKIQLIRKINDINGSNLLENEKYYIIDCYMDNQLGSLKKYLIVY